MKKPIDRRTLELLDSMRPELTKILEQFVTEPNDAFTRVRVECYITKYLTDLMHKKVINDAGVTCDEGNNTPSMIDNNIIKVDMFVKLTSTSEFILIPITVSPRQPDDETLAKFDRAMQGI